MKTTEREKPLAPLPAAAPVPAADRPIDPLAGFKPVEAQQFGPLIQDRDTLRDGVLCTYKHTQVRGERNNKIHTFQMGPRLFSLWGTASLDALIRGIRAGSYVHLRYEGMKQNAAGNDEYQWTMQNGSALSSDRRNAAERAMAPAMLVFADVIDRVRIAGRDFVPPHSDVDFPG